MRDRGDRRARHVQLLDAEERAAASAVIGDAARLADRRRRAACTGESASSSKYSPTLLAQHARREGTEALAELDLQVHHRLHLRRARVAEDAAAAERARAELHPALEPADDLAPRRAARRCGRAAPRVGEPLVDARRRASRNASISSSEKAGPRYEPCMRSPSARRRRVRSRAPCARSTSATPSAPPASPAAGWIQSRSNGPSRSSRPLPTQLSATPPARQRFFMPGLAVHVRAPCAA